MEKELEIFKVMGAVFVIPFFLKKSNYSLLEKTSETTHLSLLSQENIVLLHLVMYLWLAS